MMYKFWGRVRKRSQRGKALGFPTANVKLHKVIPEGIYISKTKIGNSHYRSLTFIGPAKTFNEKRYHSETYVLDFNKDLYGQWISVALLKKIRNNQKFASVDELVAQMKKDEEVARKYFTNFPIDEVQDLW